MMLYFDTDVLVHHVVKQDQKKHQQAQDIILESVKEKTCFISFLALQEFSFVLGKINVEPEVIINNIKIFSKAIPVNYSEKQFNRAVELAKQIGFKHINDCIHTAIAEDFCDELITYNKDDFSKIKKFSSLKIRIL